MQAASLGDNRRPADKAFTREPRRTKLEGEARQRTEEGWSQRKIAEEIGASKGDVQRRQARLGVKSRDGRGGARVLDQPGPKDGLTIDEPVEIVDVDPEDIEPPDEPSVRTDASF